MNVKKNHVDLMLIALIPLVAILVLVKKVMKKETLTRYAQILMNVLDQRNHAAYPLFVKMPHLDLIVAVLWATAPNQIQQ
jgi:hypothetical protein